MARTVGGWARRVLAGLALVGLVLGIGGAGAFLLRERPIEGMDVIYGESGGQSLRLDIYKPTGPAKAKRPAVLLIHGGGWAEGDKASQKGMAEGLARMDYVAIAVGYRLARDDASRHPAQVDDVRRAVRWVRAHAGALGVDPDRIGAYGHSAGGHLAAILGTTDAQGTGDPALKGYSSRVRCVVDVCGPTDFIDESSPAVGPSIAWMVPNLFGKTRDQALDAYLDASPARRVDSHAAPTLILHGTADDIVPIDQSRKLRDALVKAGVEVKLVELEDEWHIFRRPENGETMIRETIAFLDRHLKP